MLRTKCYLFLYYSNKIKAHFWFTTYLLIYITVWKITIVMLHDGCNNVCLMWFCGDFLCHRISINYIVTEDETFFTKKILSPFFCLFGGYAFWTCSRVYSEYCPITWHTHTPTTYFLADQVLSLTRWHHFHRRAGGWILSSRHAAGFSFIC